MKNGSCLRSGHKPWGNLGRSRAAGTRGAEPGGMARGSQEAPQSGMNWFLGTVLLLLLLPDVAAGQDSCSDLHRGDQHRECCSVALEQQSPGSSTRVLRLSQHCPELWRSQSRACACLRERWLRLLQSGRHGWLAGLKALILNVSRAVTRDVLVTFSPTEGPSRLNSTEKGKAGKIHLPREIFRSLSSQTVRVVVTVLNIQQLGIFKEVNQTAQVLDNTVVGIAVGESSISGLQDPVQLTFTHTELPQNPALDGSTAKAVMAVATAGCGVAVAFSIFTMAFCIFIRCRFRFEDTVRTNLGLHLNLVGSLLLLNLAFLLNSGLSGRTHPSTCGVLGGLTHYCLLCCFTWTALEGCQLYLLFVKVLGIYIHHYLAKLCLVGWGFPALVVGVAGAIGSYGEYSIQTMDQQVIAHLCWITSKHLLVHYITNCGYFGLIFLFNMAVFGVAAQKSCSLQGTGAVQGNRKPWKVALVAAGLFCLLGATWALAFLTYGISSAAVLYLFTVLNSLQGIFIFIWLVVLYYPKTKETTGSLSYIIRHDKTTTASQD
ncbi:adhesion G protein-coupled receptor G3-like isoform X3 [Passer montanus]|uniref:adhesion G protein-coupled receptor G3-like isoform X3 n=1 Tax=Passer montanus TaxID=9160 RepID=UPI001961B95B|nr:adhesion G protein-coupled receptor G3-like isoform X3 [Passer montanus]